MTINDHVDVKTIMTLNQNSTPDKRSPMAIHTNMPSLSTIPVGFQQADQNSQSNAPTTTTQEAIAENLKLIQQVNDKIDEVFTSLCQLIEQSDSKQLTKLDDIKLETDKQFLSVTSDLELKANKKSVQQALHKKSNKIDIAESESAFNK